MKINLQKTELVVDQATFVPQIKFTGTVDIELIRNAQPTAEEMEQAFAAFGKAFFDEMSKMVVKHYVAYS